MLSLVLVPALLFAGFDVGGRVGAAFPVSGLGTHHGSSALLAAQAAFASGRTRVELAFTFISLPGRQNSPYRMDLNELSLTCGYELLHRPTWGIEAYAGPGYALARRRYGSGSETGRAPTVHAGAGIVQHEGRSRLSLGLGNCLFIEPAGNGRLALSDIVSLRAGVAYAF